VGTQTDAALAKVVAARADFDDELDRLEAAGRAAVDIPAKVKREPAKAAGVVAGAAFLALGGPKRLFRRAKRLVTGKEEEELPPGLLPKEVDKVLSKLGDDGKKVRNTLEREFGKYVVDRSAERKKEGAAAAGIALAATALRPVAIRIGKSLAERALNPDGPSFEQQLQRLRDRRKGADTGSIDEGGPTSGAGI
jgi:hypothetical protein